MWHQGWLTGQYKLKIWQRSDKGQDPMQGKKCVYCEQGVIFCDPLRIKDRQPGW